MKFAFRYVLCAILLAELPSAAMHFAAQEVQPTSRPSQSLWMGEWGSFHPAPSRLGQTPGVSTYFGRSVSITDCAGQQCKASINVQTQSGHCEAPGTIQVESETAATVDLHQSTFQCSLYLEKKDGKEITVKPGQENCSAFCTSGAAFIGSYPLKSQSTFFGDNGPACYAGAGASQAAICSSQELATQETEWRTLIWQTASLTPGLSEPVERQKIFDACDRNPQPASCLTNHFSQSTQILKARKSAWQAEVTEVGDRQEALEKIAAIAGSYRHPFTQGDVEGNTYSVTDKLDIEEVSDTSIHYSLMLYFFNGHQCSREGVASYKRNGTFVDAADGVSEGKCVFELVPTAEGIKFADPTGICKQDSCGERGGYNGTSFLSSERTATRR